MTKNTRLQERKLEELEAEFTPLLLDCLRRCAQGRWGLFGQNDHLDPDGTIWRWPEARRAREIALEIQSIHSIFGTSNDICDEFLRLCALRGSNVLGEPKLAAEFLKRLEQPQVTSG